VCAKARRTDHPLSRLHLQFKSSTRDLEIVKCRTATQHIDNNTNNHGAVSRTILHAMQRVIIMAKSSHLRRTHLCRRDIDGFHIATTRCTRFAGNFSMVAIISNNLSDAVTPRPTRSLVVLSRRLVCQYTPLATERELAPPMSNGSNNPPVTPN
jgi:hypothetical protein